jgi:hypothetical protein
MVGASLVFSGITAPPPKFLWAMSAVWQSAARSEQCDFDETGISFAVYRRRVYFGSGSVMLQVSVFKLTKRGGQRASVFLR